MIETTREIKTIRIWSALALILIHLPVQAFDSCESIFDVGQDLGAYGVNAQAMGPHYISMFRDHKKARGFSAAGVLTVDTYNSTQKGFATVISSFKTSTAITSQDTSLFKLVHENIEFVLKTYEGRREWSVGLRDQLREETENYATQSTYVEVRRLDPITLTPAGLMGTLKLVQAGAGFSLPLPMEKDFAITLPTNGGRKFEPANLAISKADSKQSFPEIATQLILHARNQLNFKNHERDKLMYFTACDAVNRRLYGAIGFKLIAGFESPLIEGQTQWWMMGASAETLADLPSRLAASRATWSASDSEWLNRLVTNFEGLIGSKTELEGWRTAQVQTLSGKRASEVGVFLSEPFTSQGKDFRRLSIVAFSGPEVDLNLQLPVEDFPLREGWREDLNNGSVMEYKNGVFHVQSPTLKLDASLKTDPDFIHPVSLTYRDRRNSFTAAF